MVRGLLRHNPPMHPVKVAIRVLPHGEGLPLPRYASEGAAGCDLHAAVGDPMTQAESNALDLELAAKDDSSAAE